MVRSEEPKFLASTLSGVECQHFFRCEAPFLHCHEIEGFSEHDAVAFVPPGGVRIAQDFANAFVEQKGLDWPKKWQDQFEIHSGSLTTMEAQSFDRASESRNASLTRLLPPGSLHRDLDLPEQISLPDQA